MSSAGVTTVTIEVFRGKGYPQTEADPDPCTTQVAVTLYDAAAANNNNNNNNDDNNNNTNNRRSSSNNDQPALGTTQCTTVQEKNNAPFYKETLRFEVPPGVAAARAVLRVLELSRTPQPTAVLFGEIEIPLGRDSKAREVNVPLTATDPAADPQGAARERAAAVAGGADLALLVLRPQVRVARGGGDGAAADAHADVPVTRESVVANGALRIVPADSEYVWLRLLSDKRFCEGYRQALCTCWASRAAIRTDADAAVADGAGAAPAAGAGAKKGSKKAAGGVVTIATVGDVVSKKWLCRRTHEVLTRLRMTAEMYARGDTTNLNFTRDAERAYRQERKQRTFLIVDLCQDALLSSSSSSSASAAAGGGAGAAACRDWLTRLWVLYSTGIDNDPSGPKQVSYEVRKRALEHPFSQEDAVVLGASLLAQLVPSLAYDYCLAVNEVDFAAEPMSPMKKSAGFATGAAARVGDGQRRFTNALAWFVGPLCETITEAEVARVCKGVKPAVKDAHERIAKGALEALRKRVENNETAGVGSENNSRFHVGDGIKIGHLDKYGNRKKSTKYA